MPQILDRFRSSTWGWLRGTLLGWLTLLLCRVREFDVASDFH